MAIDASLVKELRDKTGAGFMDCKKALLECEGDFEKSVDHLRAKGLALAARKSEREASEGLVGAYIHGGSKIGVLLEVNCETDFVARTEEFQALVKDISMQIAAANPRYVQREDVGEEELDRERSIYRQQAAELNKPAAVLDKIVDGKMERFYEDACLMEQAFIKEPTRRVKDLIQDAVARLGENIRVRRFVRYTVGEGMKD
ncbi:MAG: translation elongation factor Ts [Deltaproteobacteria bacterium]|nr:translation elongation factor Ts [Deltaproteobacteria bacterium]MDE0214808.1 translation elongation factor Ts [Deltaproteobacteria bacterium]MDE0341843.1 translation elongation factor Ts [Deltaproteobacteria bacterium]